ncbi:BA75_05077T0 [Komagataella pastoris]|uniref:BA75_05077T0 n=1 Tax=Komagataella pastoris TaxID=4922 RepID=A0A1B2JHV9_PICPA|nr:BA75_05077T0 [Komagataella pastoris]
MVFKTLASLSKQANKTAGYGIYHHPFFEPSYTKTQNICGFDNVIHNDNKTSQNKTKYVAAVSTTANNLIIIDQKNGDPSDTKSRKLLIKKSTHKVSKNGHVSISVTQIDKAFSKLSIRKSNSALIRTFTISNNSLKHLESCKRFYSTDRAARLLDELNMNEESNRLEQGKKSAQIEELEETAEAQQEEQSSTSGLEDEIRMIHSFVSQKRYNEVFALYLRAKAKEIKLDRNVYTMVLRAITKRETNETVEEKLTHLLNVYSDLLTSNIKPNKDIYELVIGSLLAGATKQTYEFTTGQDFLKIAIELLIITKDYNASFAPQLYRDLLTSLNMYKFNFGITNNDLQNMCGSIINEPVYYMGLIKLCQLSQDSKGAIELYHTYQSQCNENKSLVNHQFEIYSVLVQTLIGCHEKDMATKFLNSIIEEVRVKSGMSSQIKMLLSSYLIGLANINQIKECETMLATINQISWLPDVSVKSLLFTVKKCLDNSQPELAWKFWNFAVTRSDFDSDQALSSEKLLDEYVGSDVYNMLVVSLMNSRDTNHVVKFCKEMLIKSSIQLEVQPLLSLIRYLRACHLDTVLLNVVVNQGNKSANLNQYLSIVIDSLPVPMVSQLMNTNFFKKCCEDYRLVKDNIYGIMKAFKLMEEYEWKQQQTQDTTIMKKFSYYKKVISYELNEISNHYVEIPEELEQFKQYLAVGSN